MVGNGSRSMRFPRSRNEAISGRISSAPTPANSATSAPALNTLPWPRRTNARRPDARLGVAAVDVLSALRAHDSRAGPVTAGLVQKIDGRGRQIGPFVAPLHQRRIDREQGASLIREPVLVQLARPVLGVGAALEDRVIDKPVQAVRQNVAGESDAALVVLEPAGARG